MKPYRPNSKLFFGIIVFVTISEIAVLDSVFGISPNSLLLKSGTIISLNGLLWLIFERVAWKWPVSRMMGLSHVPDLSGEWVGDLVRSGEVEKHSFSLRITQTFSMIYVSSQSTNSRSESISAQIVTDELKNRFKIINHWQSRTRAKQVGYMDDFVGLSTIDVSFENGEITLSDYYFTNRKPTSTEGVIKLRRKRAAQ